MTSVETSSASSVSTRLEALPYGRFHKRLLLMGGTGYAFDAMDGAIIAFVLPILISLWSLSNVEAGLIVSATYIGYFFGAIVAGTFGDVLGRRLIMMSALAIFSVASLISAFSPNWNVFFVLRIIAGFGIGAESAIVAPFLSEFVASRYRGRFIGSLAGFFSFGFLGAAVLGYLLVPRFESGWMLAIIVTSLPIFLLLWWRRELPESPRWLVSQGRQAEAEAIVGRIEEQCGVRSTEPGPEEGLEKTAECAAKTTGFFRNVPLLWSAGLRRITLMSWILWISITFSYYSFFTWIPTLLVQNGMSVTKSFTYSIAIYAAQVPGYFSAAFMNEILGRKFTIVSYLLLGSLSGIGLATSGSDLTAILASICLSFFMNGTYAGVYAYTAEIYPTRVRATGVGLSSAMGRVSAIVAPVLVGVIYPLWGFFGIFGITTIVLVSGALAVMLLGINTRGISLEELEQRQLG
ncbi:MFS transporter [Halioxenophilus sp. WMMB6]|uniref:MFS transporter n=1 Tax=Halioxenophilus sp. WMMB6 TaxID=3073815 RepID=UPI00295F18F4|nr:MFS transporter [Halioxenophilus sp. WMMB6]